MRSTPISSTYETTVDQLREICTFVPDAGMTFDQILVDADEPLLFHTA